MRTKANSQLFHHPKKIDHTAEREAEALALVKQARKWAERIGATHVSASTLYDYINYIVRERQQADRARRDHWRLVGERAKALMLSPLAA